MIHAGIDGYSRIPVFCSCSNNNTAETVLKAAVNNFGLPSIVRCDRGTENYNVGYFMLDGGLGRGSIIPGRSVHNQRIERWWRDLYVGCKCVFYNLFYHMENTGLLDPMNNQDTICVVRCKNC